MDYLTLLNISVVALVRYVYDLFTLFQVFADCLAVLEGIWVVDIEH